jgi:hypothetical protein
MLGSLEARTDRVPSYSWTSPQVDGCWLSTLVGSDSLVVDVSIL